jgi:hypothetical protein
MIYSSHGVSLNLLQGGIPPVLLVRQEAGPPLYFLSS